jgi:hypothetical protein
MDINQLTNRTLTWVKVRGHPEWIVWVDGQKYVLVMNDFPDEVMYTVKSTDDAFDLDDCPVTWTLSEE